LKSIFSREQKLPKSFSRAFSHCWCKPHRVSENSGRSVYLESNFNWISAATCAISAILLSAEHYNSLLLLYCCSLTTSASPSSSTSVSLLI
jgi:hypothetical protein